VFATTVQAQDKPVPPYADKSQLAAKLRVKMVTTYICVARKELPVAAYDKALVEYRTTMTPLSSKAAVDHDLALVDSALLVTPATMKLIVLGFPLPCSDMLRLGE
jgi:hypothetical protein